MVGQMVGYSKRRKHVKKNALSTERLMGPSSDPLGVGSREHEQTTALSHLGSRVGSLGALCPAHTGGSTKHIRAQWWPTGCKVP